MSEKKAMENRLIRMLENLEIVGRQVPQWKPLDDTQVPNNAGGFVWQVDDLMRLRRFLCLGTEGGTYYTGEKELTVENAQAIARLIECGRGAEVVREVLTISEEGRAAKQNPTMFALAMCARYKVTDVRNKKAAEEKEQMEYLDLLEQSAYEAFPRVCRIPTHVFTFVQYCELISSSTGTPQKSTGWGRRHRRAIASWYLDRPASDLAMAVTKYQQRNGWSHRDLLRLTHAKAQEEKSEHGDIFCYVVKGWDGLNERKRKAATIDDQPESKVLRFLDAVETLKRSADETQAAGLIRSVGLVREHVPTTLLSSVNVWEALLDRMPMTALMRNLAKMTSIGVLGKGKAASERVARVLTDVTQLQKSRIHPFNVLLALHTYKSGRGEKGSLTWEPDQRLVKALDEAFYLSFKNVPSTGKRYLLALDVSGSMGARVNGSCISCREAAAAMALVTMRTEPDCQMVAFETKLTPMPVKPDWSLNKVVEYTGGRPFGGTDCSQPMVWAKRMGKRFDVFVVFTDSETWAGKKHPSEALVKYREASGIAQAKLVVVGMAANEFTIADPKDPGMLDIVGFDSAAPEVMRNFVMGLI